MNPEVRRNFTLGVIHECLWGFAFGLINPSTLLSQAITDLGGGASATGWLTGLCFGGINLPQLFSAFWFSPRFTEPPRCAALHAPALACTGASACLFFFFPDMAPPLKLT